MLYAIVRPLLLTLADHQMGLSSWVSPKKFNERHDRALPLPYLGLSYVKETNGHVVGIPEKYTLC